MKAVLIIPKGLNEGNLIWRIPYIYPKEHLEDGIEQLKTKGFIFEWLEDGIGLAFRSKLPTEEAVHNLKIAFRWMDITCYNDEEKIDFESVVFDYAIVALPLGRLKIDNPILSDHICLFPAGYLWIYNLRNLDGSKFGTKTAKLRDYITSHTKVSIEVFQDMPLMVFPIKISYKEYVSMNQMEDNDLIIKCSEKAERVMDLVRFYGADYVLPEWLPSRAGIWNDRYSAMYIFFPKEQISHIQSREVELKSFIKGIGMEFTDTDNLNIHPLMTSSPDELQSIIIHALRLHSAIQETDNDTMKFAQIMMLFDYIGNPNEYANFQTMKAQFVPVLARDKHRYHQLSERFKQLTKGYEDASGKLVRNGLRTDIVHLGKSILDLMPDPKGRKALFQELHGYIYTLIHHMIISQSSSWKEYEAERTALRTKILT